MASRVVYETQTRFGSEAIEVFGYGGSSLFLYPIKEAGVANVKIYPESFNTAVDFLLSLFESSSNFEQEIQKYVQPEFKLEKIKFEFNQVEITLDSQSNQEDVFNIYSMKKEEMLNEIDICQPY